MPCFHHPFLQKRRSILASNYRPITLLNHDAKLGPNILAHRLKRIQPRLSHPDQNGSGQFRSIRQALIRFQDLQTLCRQKFATACVVLLDLTKASTALYGLHYISYFDSLVSTRLSVLGSTCFTNITSSPSW